MSENQNIFNNQNTNSEDNSSKASEQNVNSDNNFADLLSSIRNERGEPKYKDVKTALEALRHSQEFIPQLKTENEKNAKTLADLAAEVERLRNIEQTVAQLTQNNQNQNTTAPVIDEESVAKLVDATLTKKQKEEIRKSNINTVVSSLQKVFGTEAENTFYTKAAEFGMGREEINNLAATSPSAVLTLFGINSENNKSSSNFTAPKTDLNTAAFQPKVDSYIGRNPKAALVGATTQDLQIERENSKKLVEELHSKGQTISDLTDPKTYFKLFANQ